MLQVNTLQKKAKKDRYNVDELKERLKEDRDALDVFGLAGVDSSLIDYVRDKGRERSKGAPCPVCGGEDRFTLLRARDAGQWAAYCRGCDRSYTPLDLLMTTQGLDLNEAVREIVDTLDGADVPAFQQQRRAPSAVFSTERRTKHGRRIIPEEEATARKLEHVYKTETGAPVYKVERVEYYDLNRERVAIDRNGKTEEKKIVSYDWNGEQWEYSRNRDRSTVPPYNLDKLAKQREKKDSFRLIYIVEGEKTADRLQRALESMEGEAVATTTGAATNARLWKQWGDYLNGALVFVCPDNDEQGRQAGAIIAAIAEEAGASVNLIDVTKSPDGQPAPAGYDVGDYLDDLERLDPSAEAFEQLNALAVPFIPSAVFPLQGEEDDRQQEQLTTGEEGKTDDGELDPVERRRRREEAEQRRNDEIETLLTLPPFPVDVIPKSLLDYADFYARKFNAPVSTAIKQALCNFSGLIGRLYSMTAPAVGYTETRPLRPNLSVLIIGDSGAGKTPLFDAILEPITLLQREIEEKQTRLNAQYAEELENQNAAKLEKKKLESKRKRIKDDAQLVEIDEKLDALDDVIFKPLKEPRPQQELYTDPETPEGVLEAVEVNLLSGYTNAPIVATDEGISFFSSTYNPSGTLAGFKKFSKLEDGSRFKVKLKTKKASGDTSNPAPRLAAFNIGIQPEVLAECFNSDALRRQGLLNRFLFDDQAPNFNVDIVDEELDEETRNRYLKPFYEAFKTCKHYERSHAATAEELDAQQPPGDYLPSMTYCLDENKGTAANPSAVEVFRDFRVYCRQKQEAFHAKGQKTLVAFYAKLQKIVLKYAVLLRTWEAMEGAPGAVVKISDAVLPQPTIDAAIMRRAVSVAKWDGLKREALEAALLVAQEEGGALLPVPCQEILKQLQAAFPNSLTKTEITKDLAGLQRKKNARKFALAIKRLIDDGLIIEEREKRGNNERPVYRYLELGAEALEQLDDSEEDDEE